MRRLSELDVLARHGWLADTPQHFCDAVLSRCIVKRCARDEALYRANDPPGGLYGLVEGWLGVELVPADRDAVLGVITQPGFWIGEASPVARMPRLVDVRCITDSVVAHLPLPQWDAIAHADPEAWRWLCLLVLRNEALSIRVVDALLVQRASARVAALLIVLATSGSMLDDDARREIEIDIGKQHIARMANLSRSSVERILKEFAASGLIETGYRLIRIVDLAGLRRHRASDSDNRAV